MDIGIRELKIKASEIVRGVREERSRYIITHRGRPVAALVPLEEAGTEVEDGDSPDEVWEELTRLGEEIGKGWKSRQTSTEILSEMRD
jgi:prevent-host-death family protein